MKQTLFILLMLTCKIAIAAYLPVNGAETKIQCAGNAIALTGNGTITTPYLLTSNKNRHYNSSGEIMQPMKIWHGVVTPSSGSNNTVDISSAGFTTIVSANVSPRHASTFVHAQIDNVTTTQLTYDLYQLNTTGVTILSINVIGTAAMGAPSSLTGISCDVQCIGF